jgi:hypothetical protein
MKIYLVIRKAEVFAREIAEKTSLRELRLSGHIALRRTKSGLSTVEIGEPALKYLDNTEVMVCSPFDHTQFSYFDPAVTELYLKEFIKRFTPKIMWFPPSVLVHLVELKDHDFSEIEIRGMRDIVIHCGAREVRVVRQIGRPEMSNQDIIELFRSPKRPQTSINLADQREVLPRSLITERHNK